MKIEIHIRDTNNSGKFLKKAGTFVESCRVYNEAGDRLRLNNLAPLAYAVFKKTALDFVNAYKSGDVCTLMPNANT